MASAAFLHTFEKAINAACNALFFVVLFSGAFDDAINV
jgi:hypothetical protein